MSPTHTNRWSIATVVLSSALLTACADTDRTVTDPGSNSEHPAASECIAHTVDDECCYTEQPLQPVVSCLELLERNGIMCWKDTHEPFTGSTIVYYGGHVVMFSVAEYEDGREFLRGGHRINPDCPTTGRREDSPMERGGSFPTLWFPLSNHTACSGELHLEGPLGILYPQDALCQDAVRAYVARHGPDHDEYWFYQRNGKEDDLPILLYGLREMGDVRNGVMACTRSHCLNALRNITGGNEGVNYADWAEWWRNKYNEEPPEWKPEVKKDS